MGIHEAWRVQWAFVFRAGGFSLHCSSFFCFSEKAVARKEREKKPSKIRRATVHTLVNDLTHCSYLSSFFLSPAARPKMHEPPHSQAACLSFRAACSHSTCVCVCELLVYTKVAASTNHIIMRNFHAFYSNAEWLEFNFRSGGDYLRGKILSACCLGFLAGELISSVRRTRFPVVLIETPRQQKKNVK